MKKICLLLCFVFSNYLFGQSNTINDLFDNAKTAYNNNDLYQAKNYLMEINSLIDKELINNTDEIIEIEDFVNEFLQNEIAAAKKYGGKTVKLKGYAKEIERLCDPRCGDGPGWVPAIKLADKPFTSTFNYADCYCSLDMEDLCATINRGTPVIIEGVFYENTYRWARIIDCKVYILNE